MRRPLLWVGTFIVFLALNIFGANLGGGYDMGPLSINAFLIYSGGRLALVGSVGCEGSGPLTARRAGRVADGLITVAAPLELFVCARPGLPAGVAELAADAVRPVLHRSSTGGELRPAAALTAIG